MAAASEAVSAAAPPAAGVPNLGKRKRGKGKGKKNKKLPRSDQDDSARRRRNKPSAKFLKLLRKRARDYNSDDSEEGDDRREEHPRSRRRDDHHHHDDEDLSHSEQEEDDDEDEKDEEQGASSSAVTRFEQGCRAFRVAFLKIMAKKLPDDPLGPIMSAHKSLVAAKLAEDAEERKPKRKLRKEKQAAAEKGHVIPKDHLDSKEKELIKIATKGVVRLFNAVSKAQKPRKDLNPSSTKDAKVIARERKSTFLAELEMSSHQDKKSKASSNFSKHTGKDEDEPAWAPLRDTYMLGSKLKDWDKMKDSAAESEQTKVPLSDSSDED